MNWISVKDKLPIDPNSNGEQSDDVLITNGESISVGYYESEYHIDRDPEAYEGQKMIFSSETWHAHGHYLNTCISGFPEVTHWMPLPDLPKKT